MNQERAFDILKSGGNVFLTGSAGAGKTHLLNRYIRHLRAREMAAAVTASTGIAATHLGGVTIHSWSGLGVRDALSDDDLDDIARKRPVRNRVGDARVLIIDEISMLSAQTLGLVDQIMRKLRRGRAPFGGVQIVFCGDFFQLPPVSRAGAPAEPAFMAPVWKEADLRVCYLDESHRHGDDALARLLNDIRSGAVSNAGIRSLEQKLQDGRGASFDNILKLHTHNADVDAANARKLRELPGATVAFDAVTAGTPSVVDSLKRFVMAPEHLELKQHAQVMFVKNNPSENYLNGTLGVVEGFEDDLPVVKTFQGERITARPAEWSVQNELGDTLASYTQVPLRLAWAITVHKSQGMTLDHAAVDLSKTFELGQGYVAFSRVRTWDGLQLSGYNARALQVDPLVLKADRRLRALSAQAEDEFAALSDGRIAQLAARHVANCDGLTDPAKIKRNEEQLAGAARTRKPRGARSDTLSITKALIDAGCDLDEIAAQRKLSKRTVISHLEQLRAIEPSLDISKFKPHPKTVVAVCNAVERCREKAGEDDLDGRGQIKLTPVFLELKRAYNYEEIRLARLFCDAEESPGNKA